MVNVSAPPQIRLPKAFQDDDEIRKYFENKDFNLFLMWQRTGGPVDEVATAIRTPIEVQTFIEDIRQRLGSGDALTSDSDSFTVDRTDLFVDLTEA